VPGHRAWSQEHSRPVSGSIKEGVSFIDSNPTSTEAERVATRKEFITQFELEQI
jgi:hypothetical protein